MTWGFAVARTARASVRSSVGRRLPVERPGRRAASPPSTTRPRGTRRSPRSPRATVRPSPSRAASPRRPPCPGPATGTGTSPSSPASSAPRGRGRAGRTQRARTPRPPHGAPYVSCTSYARTASGASGPCAVRPGVALLSQRRTAAPDRSAGPHRTGRAEPWFGAVTPRHRRAGGTVARQTIRFRGAMGRRAGIHRIPPSQTRGRAGRPPLGWGSSALGPSGPSEGPHQANPSLVGPRPARSVTGITAQV